MQLKRTFIIFPSLGQPVGAEGSLHISSSLFSAAKCRPTRGMSLGRIKMIKYYIRSMLKSLDNKLSEWGSTLLMLVWSYVLWTIPNLWLIGPYRSLGTEFIIAQNAFMYVCLGVGVFRLVILTVNGTISKSPHLRTAGALISCVIWLQVWSAFRSQDVLISTTYAVICLTDFIAMIRAARDSRIYDEIALGEKDGGD